MFKWFYAPAAPGQEKRTDSICGEKEFLRALARERARAERSAHRFSLVVFETGRGKQSNNTETKLLGELNTRMRATDEAGWLRQNRIGAILHNATAHNAWSFAKNIQMSLLANGTQLPCQVYSYPPPQKNGTKSDEKAPEKQVAEANPDQQFSRNCPGEELRQYYTKKMTRKKRSLDLLGSLLGLIILSPLFIILWCVIKSVSRGPAIYKQTRIGLGGRPFTFLKFRTMAINADTTTHRDYLASLIQGENGQESHSKPTMAKLDDNDGNIIPFGKLIRKTYLDELPQLFNVLLGDMSLIGPRPPIPYEVEEYQLWHTGRFDTTPGMTGLWQVSGKNRLTFDQMVRLDIQYIRRQSFWMDLKILLMTPMVIASELKRSLNKIEQLGMGAKKIKL
jgi:lipopolysaccharide/colanic/teichoic acid biosynthesis glycosyltransferase